MTENKFYSLMLIAVLADSICSLALQLLSFDGVTSLDWKLGYYINKLDFVFLLTYAGSFLVYIILISYGKILKSYQKPVNIILGINIAAVILISLTRLDMLTNNGYTTINGISAYITFAVSGFYMLLSLIIALINIKKLDRRYIPAYFTIIIILTLLLIYIINPYVVIISLLLTFMNYIMFFTIENPDLKVITQLSDAKKKAEKYVNEKEIFSFNMSQKIKDPISDIDEICKELETSNDVDKLKEGIKAIKLSSSKIMYLVSDTLSGIGAGKIDIVEDEYNVLNLFTLVNQFIKSKSSKYNVTYYDSKYNKDVIAVGDNLKIKQVVSSFGLGLVKLVSGKSLTLNTTSYNKEDNIIVSFEFILPSINLTLEELNKNEEIGKYEDIDFENISLSKLKKLINLLDGYIEIKNVDDSKLNITINFEQKKSIIQNKESLKFLDDYEKQTKDKPSILIVDDNEEKEGLNKVINHFKYNVIVAKNGEECLNMIREGKDFDLIILDDDLEKLDTMTIFNKLCAIENFDIPVVYAGKEVNLEKENYLLEQGFADVLLKPLKQKEVDELINKYVK